MSTLRNGLAVLGCVVLAGCGTAHQAVSSNRPPTLHLSASARVAEPSTEPGLLPSAVYRLDAALPAGVPPDQPVYRLPAGPADTTVVRRLATALGVSESPRLEGLSWVAGSGLRVLRVSGGAGQPWSFGAMPCGLPQPVPPGSDAAAGVAPQRGTIANRCLRSIGPPQPGVDPTPSAPVEAATARAAADPVLAAVGLADAPTQVLAGGSMVTVDPTVDGRPTADWQTVVDVGSTGVLAAHGWLARPVQGPAYPVISARDAFTALSHQPRPLWVARCPTRAGAAPSCPQPQPLGVVTGATLGLALRDDGGDATLVPAWLFHLQAQPEPAVQVAVSSALLAPPVGAPTPIYPAPPASSAATSSPVPSVGPPAPSGEPGLPGCATAPVPPGFMHCGGIQP